MSRVSKSLSLRRSQLKRERVEKTKKKNMKGLNQKLADVPPVSTL